MQCVRAIPVTWLGSGSCQARPSRLNTNEWMNQICSRDSVWRPLHMEIMGYTFRKLRWMDWFIDWLILSVYVYGSVHRWSILIIVQRDATQSTLFIILQVHSTYFGCQPHPSSVHKTVTTASGTGPGAHPASCKIGTGSFPGVKCGRGVLLTTHPLLVLRSWKSRAIPLPTLWATTGL